MPGDEPGVRHLVEIDTTRSAQLFADRLGEQGTEDIRLRAVRK